MFRCLRKQPSYRKPAFSYKRFALIFSERTFKYTPLSTEEATKIGINNSMIHVDFMIGTDDLSVVGIDENGKRIQLFKDGVWAI